MAVKADRIMQRSLVCLRTLKKTLRLASSRCALSSTTSRHSSQSEPEMEHLKNNPYFAKYADKLSHLQESEPDEFQSKVDQLDLEKQRRVKEAEEEEKKLKEQLKEQAVQNKMKGLDSVMKVDLIKDKTAEEIKELWTEHYSKKDCVYAVLDASDYQAIYSKAKEFPLFLYPIPREQGYEFFVQQFSGNECHFTPLISYQTHQENAPSCMTITHYTEFMEDKGIVLLRGEPDTKIISVYEAQLLALQIKMYYGVHSGLKFNLVRMFTNTPETFRHMDLVKEFENYKKDLRDKKLGEY